MKTAHVLIIGLLTLPLADVAAQVTVQPVRSKATRYQLEREVITRWGKFDPKLYFILFHNKYRKGEDRRNMKQLMPLMAAARFNLSDAEKQEEAVSEVYEQEMFKMADRTLNKSFYLLYENKIQSLNKEIDLMNAEAIAAKVDFDMLLALRQEKERINADIKLTKEAYQDDSKKAERFRVALADLKALRSYYRRLITLFKTSDKLLTK